MENNKCKVNYSAVVITGLSAFALSLLWYSPLLFGEVWLRYRNNTPQTTPQWTMLMAPLREIIASYVIALLITRVAISDWRNAIRLMLLLWLAFHAVGMAGAILWDHMPWQLGAVHAGDWLLKMIYMATVLNFWHKGRILVANGNN